MIKAHATISIDLDDIACYHAIHSLPPPTGEDPVHALGLMRFLELVDELGLQSTLFVVGRTLEHPGVTSRLRLALEAGHEIASHSYSHDYRLILRSADEIDRDLATAHRLVTEELGVKPVGFRAPGYNQSEPLLDVLEQLGYRYDSSLFPSPVYFGVRAMAIASYRLRGQPSRSLRGDPRHFSTGRVPYRPVRGRFHRAGNGPTARDLVELPIAVTPFLRLPYIGTSLAALPRMVSRPWTELMLTSAAPINLELHGIDFIDRNDPGVAPALVSRQRDLRIPAPRKVARLRAIFKDLARRRQVLRLDQLAELY